MPRHRYHHREEAEPITGVDKFDTQDRRTSKRLKQLGIDRPEREPWRPTFRFLFWPALVSIPLFFLLANPLTLGPQAVLLAVPAVLLFLRQLDAFGRWQFERVAGFFPSEERERQEVHWKGRLLPETAERPPFEPISGSEDTNQIAAAAAQNIALYRERRRRYTVWLSALLIVAPPLLPVVVYVLGRMLNHRLGQPFKQKSARLRAFGRLFADYKLRGPGFKFYISAGFVIAVASASFLWNPVMAALGPLPWLGAAIAVPMVFVPTIGNYMVLLDALATFHTAEAREKERAALGVREVPEELQGSRFRSVLERMAENENPDVQNSIYVGQHYHGNYPVMLPMEAFGAHAHILGASESGKTSLALIPIAMQLIDKRRGPVIIVDGKGDNYLFHTIRLAAEGAGARFKWFTTKAGVSTYAFNPVPELYDLPMGVSELSGIMLEALGLEHGAGYGRSFFSGQMARGLRDALEQRPFHSLKDLYETVNANHDVREIDALKATLQHLSLLPQLNVSNEEGTSPEDLHRFEHRINLLESLQNRDVLYFHLPRLQGSATARQVSSLLLQTLLATYAAHEADGDLPPGHIIIDEFQMVLSENTPDFLEQARGFGLGLILCHQSTDQLRPNNQIDMRNAVEENTRVKIILAARATDARDRATARSGQTLYRAQSVNFGTRRPPMHRGISAHPLIYWLETRTYSESLHTGKRFDENDIIEISNHPQAAFIECNPGGPLLDWGGFPNPVLMEHAVTKDQHSAIKAMGWPASTPETLMAPTTKDLIGQSEARLSLRDQMKEQQAAEPLPEIPERT